MLTPCGRGVGGVVNGRKKRQSRERERERGAFLISLIVVLQQELPEEDKSWHLGACTFRDWD